VEEARGREGGKGGRGAVAEEDESCDCNETEPVPVSWASKIFFPLKFITFAF
jgi:hypothetical protein